MCSARGMPESDLAGARLGDRAEKRTFAELLGVAADAEAPSLQQKRTMKHHSDLYGSFEILSVRAATSSSFRV